MKKITLQAWAAAQYDPPPSAWTLQQWARKGEIWPEPEKVGSRYYVLPTARRQVGGKASAGAGGAKPSMPSVADRLRAGR